MTLRWIKSYCFRAAQNQSTNPSLPEQPSFLSSRRDTTPLIHITSKWHTIQIITSIHTVKVKKWIIHKNQEKPSIKCVCFIKCQMTDKWEKQTTFYIWNFTQKTQNWLTVSGFCISPFLQFPFFLNFKVMCTTRMPKHLIQILSLLCIGNVFYWGNIWIQSILSKAESCYCCIVRALSYPVW